MTALRTALIARAGLEGVNVFSGPVTDETSGLESIEFMDVEDETQEPASLGNRKVDEAYTIGGVIWIVKPGAGETVIAEARNRVYAVYAEVENQLRTDPKLGGLVLWALSVRASLRQRFGDSNRIAYLEFGIGVSARI